MTKLVLFLCLFGLSLAVEDEETDEQVVWFDPKTWTGPGVLPEEALDDGVKSTRRAYVRKFDVDDGIISYRRNTEPRNPVELPSAIQWQPTKRRIVRRKFEDTTIPSKWKEQFEQVLPRRSIPEQQLPVKIYVDRKTLSNNEDSLPPLVKQPIRRSGAYTAMESGPNWLGMLRSSSGVESRRQAPSIIIKEENDTGSANKNSQLNNFVKVENEEIVEKPSLKALSAEKQAEVDIPTWQRPNCACVRRTSESPIETSRRVTDGSGTRIIYQTRKSTSIKCTCSSNAVAKLLETPHDTTKETGIQYDKTQEQVKK